MVMALWIKDGGEEGGCGGVGKRYIQIISIDFQVSVQYPEME